jgi:hypothetical protein
VTRSLTHSPLFFNKTLLSLLQTNKASAVSITAFLDRSKDASSSLLQKHCSCMYTLLVCVLLAESFVWCMDHHPASAQISRHCKDTPAPAPKQLHTHVNLEGASMSLGHLHTNTNTDFLTVSKLQMTVHCALYDTQMIYLEEWSSLERLYACSLSGTTRALNAAVVRLPVSDGAMVGNIKQY